MTIKWSVRGASKLALVAFVWLSVPWVPALAVTLLMLAVEFQDLDEERKKQRTARALAAAVKGMKCRDFDAVGYLEGPEGPAICIRCLEKDRHLSPPQASGDISPAENG